MRPAAPALLGYLAVRAIGIAVLAVWANSSHRSAIKKLAYWDAGWYRIIAQRGYDKGIPVAAAHGTPHSDLAFFPLYPYAMKLVHVVFPVTLTYAGLIVAWAGALFAAWGVYAVARCLHGQAAAVMAAVTWGILPVAIVENMAYAEPLFTAFAAWALFTALTRRWIWAGVLSILAGLTTPLGAAAAAAVSLGAAMELKYLYQTRRDGMPAALSWWRPVLGGALAPVGWVGYVAWAGYQLGHWQGYFTVQQKWSSRFDGGAATFHELKRMVTRSVPLPLETFVVAAVLLASVVLFLITVAERQPVILLTFTATLLVISLGDSGSFESRARFLLPAFPLLFPIAAALAHARNRAVAAILAGSGTLCSALFGGYLLLVWPRWP
jgi:hypothetical protein